VFWTGRSAPVWRRRWDSVAIVEANSAQTADGSSSALIFRKAQSEDRWAEKFTDAAVQFVKGSASYDKLKPVAEDMSSKVFEGYPEGKLFHLRKVSLPTGRGVPGTATVGEKPVICTAPSGKYNMNIVQYTADRFPEAFAAFLKERIAKGSILPAELYAHNQIVEDAYPLHRRAGYSTFYFLQTRRGQLHRDIYLAVQPKPLKYRVVFTGLRGSDQEADVYCQISRSNTFTSLHRVRAKRELPLFIFNPDGDALRLGAQDVLLFGCKGKWEKILLERKWRRVPLVKEGLDIDLFIHPAGKQKLVIARNVYGDDANIILNTFYNKGMRQVVYLGTAGAILDYRVGDVVIPNQFINFDTSSAPFEQNAGQLYSGDLARGPNVHAATKHGRVPTLYHETLALLHGWKEKSVAAMDVEGYYLARFAQEHKDLKMAAFFIISDQTLGGSTIDETEARLDVIDDSVYKQVTFLLPKTVLPN
jgi:phosphorylase superfamily protein